MQHTGVVKARIIEVRFALSGKIVQASKRTGDIVKKYELIGSLDRKILQTELDRELNDFEKVRADFEIFAANFPNPQSDIDKYLKKEKQATLNVSVKNVELVKAKLDQCDLFSPCEGIILDDGGIYPGIYITPSSAPLKILDTKSYYFEFEIDHKDIGEFKDPRKVHIKIDGADEKIESITAGLFADGKKFTVAAPIETENIFLGMEGYAMTD